MSYAYTHTDAQPDAEPYSDGDCDWDTHGDAHANVEPDSYGDSDPAVGSYTNSDDYAHRRSRDADAQADADGHSHGHAPT